MSKREEELYSLKDVFEKEGPEMTISRLSEVSGQSVPTVYVSLQNMMRRGYVEQVPPLIDERYRLVRSVPGE